MESIKFQNYVEEVARKCAGILVEHKMVQKPKLFSRMLVVKTKNTGRGWGGLTRANRMKTRKPRISIPKRYALATGFFSEYKSFQNDPEIGCFDSENTKHHVQAIVAHEVAHAADHWNGDFSAHGHGWRVCYRMLRRELGLVFD